MTLVASKEYSRDWPLEYFSPYELACNHCGRIEDNDQARRAWHSLDQLRHTLGHALYLNSATRCPDHNLAVGGARDSYHVKGQAFDIRLEGDTMSKIRFIKLEVELIYLAKSHGFNGVGIYPGFIHLDTRKTTTPPVVWFA